MNAQLVIQNILRLALLVVLQLVLLDNISFNPYVIPNILILFVVMLPTNTKPIAMLLIAFGTGLLLDVSQNMLGFQAFAFTMTAMARILFADKLLLNNDPIVIQRPSIYAVAFQRFSLYCTLLLLTYFASYVVVETFSFKYVWTMLLTIAINVILSWAIIILYQMLFLRKER